MSRLYNILFLLIFAFAMCGCNDTADLNLEQREDIITYLTSSHSPTLLSEADAKISVENEPAFYTTSGSTTFRYIEDYYNAERENEPKISKGSTVSIIFTLYDFEDIATPTIYEVLYSNNSTIIDEILTYADYFNTVWSTEPFTFSVGSGALFGRIEDMLVGCHRGDVIEFYMTLDEAYGSSVVGLAPQEGALAFFCEILTVN